MLDRILIGSSAEPNDPNFKNVTLLLHGDGSNGAQNNTFIDSSTNNFTITRNGNTTQGSFSPYGSNWSNYFDGSGDYLYASSNAAFGVGTGDFTIECWVFPTAAWASGNYNAILQIDGTGLYFGQNNAGFGLRQSGTANIISYGTSPSLNTWTHVAIVRSGTTVTMYYNGVSVATATSSANFSSGNAWVGADAGPSSYYNGYISNLRLVKGTAVYTANFTPSTTPLTAITNTSLLTCQSNRFLDGSTNNFTITRNGDVKVSSFSPFTPSSAYSASTNGGSGYFDGSGDYLSAPSNSAFAFGTGDFTIECWSYMTGNPGVVTGLFDTRNSSSSSGGVLCQIDADFQNALRVEIGGSQVFLTSQKVILNQWNHIAIVRSSGTVKAYLNGSQMTGGSAANSTNITDTNLRFPGDLYSYWLSGYCSDFRVVKGTAVYTASFTPPSSPLSAITNTSLLAKFTNAAIFDNSMKNDLETVGNAQISTSVKKFGTGSIYFDGSGDNLFYPSNQSADCGTGDWTFEAWVYISTRTTNYPLIFGNNRGSWTTDAIALTASNSDNAAYNDKFVFAWNNGGFSSVSAGNSQLLVSNTTNSTATWYHFAVVRNGTSVKMYRNGTEVASATVSSSASFNWGYNGTLLGGGNWDGAQSYFNGYLDDVRLSKVARYTSSFTPPTAAFPNK